MIWDTALIGQEVAPAWQKQFGSSREFTEWSTTARGIGQKKIGSDFSVEGNTPKKHIQTKTGRFSSRKTVLQNNGPSKFGQYLSHVDSFLRQGDVILPVGDWYVKTRPGSSSRSSVDYMNAGEIDVWQDMMYEQFNALMELDSDHNIYLQLGNEINSKKTSQWIRTTQGIKGKAKANDPLIIETYVESYLVPLLAAFKEAELNADGKKPFLLLGTIANAGNPASRDWLESLLNYRIQGETSDSFHNEPVWSLVQYVGIHYLVTRGGEWQVALNALHQNWVDTGKLKGIWSTEEGGRRRAESSLGAITAAKVFGRYSYWWQTNATPRDQSRCIYWGNKIGPEGTQGNDALNAIYTAAADREMILETDLEYQTLGNNHEIYSFGLGEKRGESTGYLSFIFFDESSESNMLDRIQVKLPNRMPAKEIDLIHISVGGVKHIGLEYQIKGPGLIELELNENIKFGKNTGILLRYDL